MKLELVRISQTINKHFTQAGASPSCVVEVEATVGYWGIGDSGEPTPFAVVEFSSGTVALPRQHQIFGGRRSAQWLERIPEYPGMNPGELDWLDVPEDARAALPLDWDLPVQAALYAGKAALGELSMEGWEPPEL